MKRLFRFTNILTCLVVFSFTVFPYSANAYSQCIDWLIFIKNTTNNNSLNGTILIEYKSNREQMSVNVEKGCEFRNKLISSDSVKFTLKSDQSFVERDVTIYTSSIEKNSPGTMLFYMAKKYSNYTYQYLQNGLSYIDRREYDRALAHYHAAYLSWNKGDQIISYDVKLKYNYARSLFNTCINHGYSTCNDAKLVFQDLKDSFDKNSELFNSSGITEDMLNKPLTDIDEHILTKKYISMKNNIGSDPEKARNILETMINEQKNNPKIFKDIGINSDRLQKDREYLRGL